ncbi:hypothetical protein ACP275_14G295300 [Erythranthe tilingii]
MNLLLGYPKWCHVCPINLPPPFSYNPIWPSLGLSSPLPSLSSAAAIVDLRTAALFFSHSQACFISPLILLYKIGALGKWMNCYSISKGLPSLFLLRLFLFVGKCYCESEIPLFLFSNSSSYGLHNNMD